VENSLKNLKQVSVMIGDVLSKSPQCSLENGQRKWKET
jgi:hypothetical protein